MTASAPPIDDGLYTVTDTGPRLVASRCRALRRGRLPPPGHLPRVHLRGRRGDPPRGPWNPLDLDHPALPAPLPAVPGPPGTKTFEPFGVGYVELPEGVRVESRLTEDDPDRLRIGMEMELVLVPFRTAEGDDRTTFAFRPAD